MSISKELKDKFIASNQAYKNVEALFKQFEERTGRRLSISTSFGKKVVFEGVYPRNWPTKAFENTFTCFVEMERYFSKALSEAN